MTTKRLSGGRRATIARHKLRDAEEARAAAGDFDTGALAAAVAELGEVPHGNLERSHVWLAGVLLKTIEDAIKDPGPKPEHKRAEIGRLVAVASKIMDPAKLAAKLGQYEQAIEELHGARVTVRQ